MTAMFQGKPIIGLQGEPGATFTPSVSAEGTISWSNDKDLPNPDPVNIKGPQGPVGPKGENAANVYSTVETIIGTWIDGKPIYRFIIYGAGKSGNVNYEIKMPNGIKIEQIIDMRGWYKDSQNFIPINFSDEFQNSPGLNLCATYNYVNNILFFRSINYFDGIPMVVILEYTKTTDTAPASQTNLLTSDVNLSDTLSSVSYTPVSASSASVSYAPASAPSAKM